MSDRKDLPAPKATNWPQRITEEVRVLMGKNGPSSARAVTIGDLAGGGVGLPGGGWGGGGGSEPYVPDLTPPPTPTGFAVSAAISHVFIEHDAPLYLMGHGHAKTRVFGAKAATGQPLPTFANAVLLTEFTGIVYAYPSDPATHWRLWIKWVTVDGVESTDPAGGTNGLGVVTGQDVTLLLDALTGKITESELYAALGQRIDLIDGNGVGSVNARVASEASTRSTVDGYLGAQQTVRVDIAGHVAGYGLAGSSPDGSGASATSSFGVRTNTFFVAPPALAQATAPTANLYDGFVWLDTSVTPALTRYRSGGTWTLVPPALPFVIQTTPTTINGVAVPAGVYANDLFVKNGTITNAKIGNLAVDDAKIANLSVSKILAGSMVVGQFINSANYISGVQGWSINAAGTAEFSNAVVRGTVYAGNGAIGGILIGGGNVYSANYVYNSSGFALFQDGWIHASNVRLRGSIMSGAYSGYSWPAADSQGFYLGPEGLLLGSAAGSRYFQLDAFGNLYAPNFSIVNGNAYFNGSGTFNGNGTFSGNLSAAGGTYSGVLTAAAVSAVDSINIAGEAVTTLKIKRGTMGAPIYGGNGAGVLTTLLTESVVLKSSGNGVVLFLENMGNTTTGASGPPDFRIVNTTTGQTLRIWYAGPDASEVRNLWYWDDSLTITDYAPAVGNNTYVLQVRHANVWAVHTDHRLTILASHR
jgi:hypothetical protein